MCFVRFSLLSPDRQPLARLGARVTGLDAAVANVTAAECHRRLDPSLQSLTYEAVTAGSFISLSLSL